MAVLGDDQINGPVVFDCSQGLSPLALGHVLGTQSEDVQLGKIGPDLGLDLGGHTFQGQ